jgi:hypothetical protein
MNKKVNLNEYYFLMSLRFDKSKPEDFGLYQSPINPDVFINEKDKTSWAKRELYDFGWGNENGFVRLPELGFGELIYLMEYSNIQDNRYGAAIEIRRKFSDELLKYLMEILGSSECGISKEMKDVFEILELEQPINRSRILGKSPQEVNDDYEKWKLISNRVKKIISG